MSLTLNERLKGLSDLGDFLNSTGNNLDELVNKAFRKNDWFTPDNIRQSLSAVATEYLDRTKLHNWVAKYPVSTLDPKIVAMVLAGNIPMVGFHDVLCSFVAGHHTMMKLSEKDDVLIPGILDILGQLDPRTKDYFITVENLKNFDAVIATGGNTAATHFSYYFGKYPHIIRRNRNSIAILDGTETEEEIILLGHDIFDYFGLGCRSVSKLYLPEDFSTDRIFEGIFGFSDIINHNKYKNNYDYNNAIFILGQEPFLTNDFIILKKDEKLASRIACVYYETYGKLATLKSNLENNLGDIQCISTKTDIKLPGKVALGSCQKPALDDYADNVDTLQFLVEL